MLSATTRSQTKSKLKRRQSRPVHVAEAIKGFVVENRMNPGDRLPVESELMKQFNNSRGTIREAMRILEAQGLVKTRTGPGGGCFVHEVSEARTSALLSNYFYFRNLTISDIYQLRKQLEPELVANLAGTLTQQQIQELEDITREYETPPETTEEDRDHHQSSLKFHARLAEHSSNKLLSFFVRFMANLLAEVTITRRLYEPSNFELWRQGREHQLNLIQALKVGDRNQSRQIMLDHMILAEKLMQSQEEQPVKRFSQF